MIYHTQITDDEQVLEYNFEYEILSDNSVRLLCAYGQSQKVVLPASIDGKALSTIGAYCFAPEKSSDLTGSESSQIAGATQSSMRRLCGDYIVSVQLPDTVRKIESYGFYNCNQMQSVELGSSLREVGSDAFMNCQRLRTLTVRADIINATGLRYILSQVTKELEVLFLYQGQVKARLLYPEYLESYEEIGPAHIFGLNVTGEGYRARQQFKDGVVDLIGYDLVFDKAVHEENPNTLILMALYRLKYPEGLLPVRKSAYTKYISEHEESVMKLLVKMQDLALLQFVCENELASSKAINIAIQLAAKQGWTKGSAGLLRFNAMKDSHSKYEF